MGTHDYLVIGDSTYKSGCKVVGSSSSYVFALKNTSVLEVQIPSSFGGSPVVEIGYQAFEFAKIKKVFIPKTIIYIGYHSFCFCYELVEVRFEKGSRLEVIGQQCFYYSYKLEKIDLPASFKKYEKGGTLFYDSKVLKCISYLGSTDFSNDLFFSFSYVPSEIKVSRSYPSDKLGNYQITSTSGEACGCNSETIFIRSKRIPLYLWFIFYIVIS